MTTIGEALNRRSDLQKRIAQLEERLRSSVLVQEDERPPEEPEELLSELDAHCTELQRLIATINHTNASSRLPTGETVTEALARRDVLTLRAAADRDPRGDRPRPVRSLQPLRDPDGAADSRQRRPKRG